MSVDWKIKLTAFLHDPPDKALRIANHEERRDNILKLIGINYDKRSDGADHVSSAMQRLNIPEDCKAYIDFSHQNKPVFKHALSAEIETEKLNEIKDCIKTHGYERCFEKYKFNIELLKPFIDKNSLEKTYLNIWRLLPEKYSLGNFLPADTRIPDHSIYDHMDVTAALAPCIEDGISFLSFKIGPVQEFIENARKTADLWSGSHLLSYLSFSAIRAVVEECGPDAVVFPYLRGQPFVDFWLYIHEIIPKPDEKRLQVSNIPHRFLAIVPKTKADELSEKIQESVHNAWLKIANGTLKTLQEKGIEIDDELKKNWDTQIAAAFDITMHSLEWANPPEDDSAVRRWFEEIKDVLPEDIVKKYGNWLAHYTKPNTGPLYGLYFELISALIDQKSRFFEHIEEPKEAGGEKGGRCSLCGVRNPVRRINQNPKQFWKEGRDKLPGMFKEGERLCAVCTVKRLYNSKEINPFSVKCDVDSVATIAMREFLDKCKAIPEYDDFLNKFNEIIGSVVPSQRMDKDGPEGEWFYLESYDNEYIKRTYGDEANNKIKDKIDGLKKELENLYRKVGKPPKYYAILVMDGDMMGKKLRGEKMPPLEKVLHPVVLSKLDKVDKYKQILGSKRILNPNIHMAISRALLEFSVNLVGSIIEKHKGLLVYSGGDDVLALLPAEKALDAAREINDVFGKDFDKVGDRNVMLLGNGSTMSAGIVFAHYKYPLYDALERAREACERAKNEYGRSAFVLVDIRHSGQISIAGGKWEIVDNLKEFVNLMLKEKEEGGLSPRFIYRLLQDIDLVEKLDNEGKLAILRYLLDRHLGEKIEKKNELLKNLSKAFLDTTNTLSIDNPMQEMAKNIRILYTVYKEGEK